MADDSEYINRVPAEHRDKTKFIETLRTILSPIIEQKKIMERISYLYDVDNAVGQQLDVVGEWVGRNRYVSIPIEGVFFSLDETDSVGFDRGVWCGEFDATSGMTRLDDDSYRFLLKLQILANCWNGTPNALYSAFRALFSDLDIVVEDNLDMSINFGVTGAVLSSAQRALFLQQIAPFKPCGVRISYFLLTQLNDTPLFAFDIENNQLNGFDRSGFAEILSVG